MLYTDSFSILSLISVFVLAALGLHFTFGMLGLVNLAHGEFLLIGAYVAFAVQEGTGSAVVGMLLAPFAAAVVGLLVERGFLRLLYDRPLDSLLATFGLAVVVRQTVQLIYTSTPRLVEDPLRGQFDVLGINVPKWRLVILIATVLAGAGVWWLINRTSFGLRARASIRNPELAETMRIDVGLMRTWLFVIGSAIAGLAGALLAPLSSISPQFGLLFLVNAFLVVILGGAGSLPGLITAGAVLGGSLALMQFWISTVLAQIIVLGIAVVGVRVRPFLVEALVARRERAARGSEL